MKKQDLNHSNVKIQPPILAMIHIVIAYLLGYFFPLPFSSPQAVGWVGLGISALGLILGLMAIYEFKRVRTTTDAHGSVKSIVSSGIYRFTRNPIYLGFVLMLIGLPLNIGSYWGIILVPVLVISMNKVVIEKEEVYLEKKFGKAYADYRSRVRRWM